jgi:hypothetical protein
MTIGHPRVTLGREVCDKCALACCCWALGVRRPAAPVVARAGVVGVACAGRWPLVPASAFEDADMDHHRDPTRPQGGGDLIVQPMDHLDLHEAVPGPNLPTGPPRGRGLGNLAGGSVSATTPASSQRSSVATVVVCSRERSAATSGRSAAQAKTTPGHPHRPVLLDPPAHRRLLDQLDRSGLWRLRWRGDRFLAGLLVPAGQQQGRHRLIGEQLPGDQPD